MGTIIAILATDATDATDAMGATDAMDATGGMGTIIAIIAMDATHAPMRPTAGGIFFERNLRTKIISSNEEIFELLERLWGGRFAANIVIKCSTQVFLRVRFFGFSLQPPKCPENMFS